MHGWFASHLISLSLGFVGGLSVGFAIAFVVHVEVTKHRLDTLEKHNREITQRQVELQEVLAKKRMLSGHGSGSQRNVAS